MSLITTDWNSTGYSHVGAEQSAELFGGVSVHVESVSMVYQVSNDTLLFYSDSAVWVETNHLLLRE